MGCRDLIAGENAKCDQQSNIVTIKAVIQLCKELKELRSAQIADTNCAGVHCIEASLLNCYGLQKLYKVLTHTTWFIFTFFNLDCTSIMFV
jgi:hypothetical protein